MMNKGFTRLEPSKKNYATIKEQVSALVLYVKSPDDLRSLCRFIVPKISGPNKTVYLGNMVKWVKPWMEQNAQNAPVDSISGVVEVETNQPSSIQPQATQDSPRRGMLKSYADRLADRIQLDMPDAQVEVKAWNEALYRVHVIWGELRVDFAKSAEYERWEKKESAA